MKLKFVLPFVFIAVVATGAQTSVRPAQHTGRVPFDDRIAPDIADVLRAKPALEVAALSRQGTATALRGKLGRVNRRGRPLLTAELLLVLSNVAPAFRVRVEDLRAVQTRTDELGHTHVRFQQTKHGLEVVGGILSLHVDENGDVYAAFGNARDQADLPLPAFTRTSLRDAEQRATSGPTRNVDVVSSRLVYVITSLYQDLHLAWEIHVQGGDKDRRVDEFVFIDVITGEVVDRHSRISHALNRKIYKFDPVAGGQPYLLWREEGGNPYFFDASYTTQNNWDRLSAAYNYFLSGHGRDSYNGSGIQLVSFVNEPGSGASWGPGGFLFSGPSGSGWGDWGADQDVVTHEFAHGITYTTSGLIYSGESGALNESFSDIMSAAHDWWARPPAQQNPIPAATWLLAENTFTPTISNDALRYMANPAQDGMSQDFYSPSFNPVVDVHYNSGIPNLAFCLLAKGGTHPQGKSSINVPALGMEKARKIFYKAFTDYLGPSSQMIDARTATVQAASVLYGSSEATTVALAWDAVGVPFVQGNNHPIAISTRGNVGTGGNILIAGLVISNSGGSAKPILLRGVGPTLAAMGVSGALSDPVLQVFSGSTQIHSNDDWVNQTSGLPNKTAVAAAASSVGAFSLSDPSADASLLPSLSHGAYTLHLSGKSGGTGVGLIEVYDADTSNPNHLVAISTRGEVTSSSPMIGGFVVSGQAHKRLLIQAVGPSLGISGTLPNPKLTLFQGSTAIRENDNWFGDPGVQAAAQAVGATTLTSAWDSAMLVAVPPGVYTVHINSVTGASGIALIEIYEVPGNL